MKTEEKISLVLSVMAGATVGKAIKTWVIGQHWTNRNLFYDIGSSVLGLAGGIVVGSHVDKILSMVITEGKSILGKKSVVQGPSINMADVFRQAMDEIMKEEQNGRSKDASEEIAGDKEQ